MTLDNLSPVLGGLPNVMRMQRVLSHASTYPDAWVVSMIGISNPVWYRETSKAWEATSFGIRHAAWMAARDKVGLPARKPAWGAVLAMAAYPEKAVLLDWPIERIRAHITLTDDSAAVLLLPAVIALATTKVST